jgi:hypothetical protein
MTAPRIRRRLASASAVAVLASLLVVGPAAAHACATHVGARLDGFVNGRQDLPYYYFAPGEGDVVLVFNAFGDECSGEPTYVDWSTFNGTALAGEDFQQVVDKRVPLGALSADLHETFNEDTLNVLSDSTPEDAVETLTVKLTGGEASLNYGGPSEAPVHIVDDDGAARVGLPWGPATTIIELDGHFAPNPDIQLPVFRAGTDTSTQVVVNYSITAPEEGDYTDITGGQVTIPIGQRHATIQLAINRDDDATDENLSIQLTGATNATLAENTSTTVVIDDNYFPGSDDDPPLTSFHHPKNGVTYKFGSAKARTVHVYAPGMSVEPSGIVDSSVKTALKRTMKSGGCKWWNGSGWVNDGCADSNRNQHWLKTEFLYIFNGKRLYEHFLKQNLPPSVGTKTKFFHVYSTAQDGAGNWDDQIDLGRNKNKFEIKKT